MNLGLLLILAGCANTQPILSQIGQLFENLGFKYVPPPAQTEKEVEEKKDSTGGVVFTEAEGWLRTGGSEIQYRLGEEAATYYSAKYYCEEAGGRLAEISSQREMETVKALLRRDPASHYWLGLEKTEREAGQYQNWAQGDSGPREPNTRFSDRCVVLSRARHWGWTGWNCGHQRDGQTEVRALCQKDPASQASQASQATTLGPEVKSEPERPRCEVSGVSLTGEDWISRTREVNTSSQCRTDCLNTYHCNYWTWRSDSRLCYLKTTDGPVVEDVYSVSGTTRAAQGCQNKLLDLLAASPVVEYCTCVSVSHHLVAGYIDPRALSQSDNTNYDHLARLIFSRACPLGQRLSCTDDEKEEAVTVPEVVEAKVPQSNITDCLVYDVRLSVGGLLSKVLAVPDGPTCHAHCLATAGCQYWTWRGDSPARKCFLLPREGRMVRRQRAASGTVREDLGCRHNILQKVEAREEEEEVCHCQPDQPLDLVSTGLIDPRLLPSGRIVNTNTHTEVCPPGHSRVCYGPKSSEQTSTLTEWTEDTEEEREGPKLWSAGLNSGSAAGRNIPKRETEPESVESAVNFPQ